MNRREAVKATGAIIAAMIIPVPTRAEHWITVCTPGCNRNGRDYTRLFSYMASAATGKLVVSHLPEAPTLDDAYGVVSEARVSRGALQVRVHWFHDPPKGCRLTPTGSGLMSGKRITHYALRQFDLNWESAFEGVTIL